MVIGSQSGNGARTLEPMWEDRFSPNRDPCRQYIRVRQKRSRFEQAPYTPDRRHASVVENLMVTARRRR